jgi:hypothetical protein
MSNADAQSTPSAPDDGLTASELEQAATGGRLHDRDRVPQVLLTAQRGLYGWLSGGNRRLVGIIIILLGLVTALLLSAAGILGTLFESLNILAFAGLFLVNWIGNGGALVPIPGARLLGLLMIFQHAVLLPSLQVFAVSGLAMSLGLLSYYLLGARVGEAYLRGDTERAEQLATDSGILASPDPGVQDVAATVTGAALDTLDVVAGADADEAKDSSRRRRLVNRFKGSFQKASDRAQPAIDQHGFWGMFWLCLPPMPLGTAGAFLGATMGFGFGRYILASFAAKFLLSGLIVITALVFANGVGQVATG